jgi:hypothetical protein
MKLRSGNNVVNDKDIISTVAKYIKDNQNEIYPSKKIVIVTNLLNYLLENIKFVFSNENFRLAVLGKILEFSNEDDFNKIGNSDWKGIEHYFNKLSNFQLPEEYQVINLKKIMTKVIISDLAYKQKNLIYDSYSRINLTWFENDYNGMIKQKLNLNKRIVFSRMSLYKLCYYFIKNNISKKNVDKLNIPRLIKKDLIYNLNYKQEYSYRKILRSGKYY